MDIVQILRETLSPFKGELERVFVGLLLIALMGCDSSQKQTGNHVTTDSAPYELLLITDKDWLKTADGMVVMEVLNSSILGLPQQESNFKIISINPSVPPSKALPISSSWISTLNTRSLDSK